MYPTQNYPMYPQPMHYCNPYGQQQVNAVKIDIHNPQAYGGYNDKGIANPVAPVENGVYNYPYVPMYYTPGSYPQPPLFPPVQQPPVLPPAPPAQIPTATTVPATPPVPQTQVPTVPPVPTAQQPVATTVPAAPPVPPAPTPVATTVPTAPAAPQPQTNVPVIPVPLPPINQEVNVNTHKDEPAQKEPAIADTIPAKVADNTENTKVAPVQPVEKQPEATSTVDVNSITTALGSTNPDDQTAAIQRIAELGQTDKASAKAFLTEQTFGQLANIINADTSNLQGPTEQTDAQNPQNLSPLEKAEMNKQFAIYTLAILQKNFREEINEQMKKEGLSDVQINDIPFIKEAIVDNLKDNPNPSIRIACLSALSYIARPEDKEVLKTLYGITAEHDSNPDVQAAAKSCLEKLPA